MGGPKKVKKRDDVILEWSPSKKLLLRHRNALGGGVSPCADGRKVTVHKDEKSPSSAFCWNADGRGVGVKNCENLPTS